VKTVLTDAGYDLFSLLTSQTFYVVDTEYTAAGDEFGGNKIISIAIVPVVQGRRLTSAELYREMNPGVSISAESSSVHGFTNESVKRKKDFAHYAKEILDHLKDPDGIFVAHTAADIRAIRSELERLDIRKSAGEKQIKVGLADLPLMPILDTSTLAGHLRYPKYGQKAVISLTGLCELTGVSYKNAHNAKGDARATADALVELLAHAAQVLEMADTAALFRVHNAGTTHAPRGALSIRTGRRSAPALPAEHLAKHLNPMSTRAKKKELQAWIDLAKECATLRCQWLRDDARVVGQVNASVLLDDVRDLLPLLTEPGQSGTLLEAVTEFIKPRWYGGLHGLEYTRALRWWGETRPLLEQVPPCGVKSELSCPSCRRGDPCPRDVAHHYIGELISRGKLDTITNKRAAAIFKRGSYFGVAHWSIAYPDIAAYAAWYVIAAEQEQNLATPAANHLDIAVSLDLHLIEPRLTRLVCGKLSATQRVDEAKKLAKAVLKGRTTDEAYEQLSQWLVWTEQSLVAQSKVVVKPPSTHPRLARPVGRENPNPYKVT